MAVGDQNDMFLRLKDNLVNWFGLPNQTPVLDSILQGIAITDSTVYGYLTYVDLQNRLQTATDINLDLIAQDYFGTALSRHAGENDASYRARISANLLQERATKHGMIDVLTKLTGRVPIVIEPFDGAYGGAYDSTLYYDKTGGFAWLEPYTAIIYAFRVQPIGFINYAGYDLSGFGYDFQANNAYVDISQEIIIVSDDDILNAIENTKCFGTYMIVYILD